MEPQIYTREQLTTYRPGEIVAKCPCGGKILFPKEFDCDLINNKANKDKTTLPKYLLPCPNTNCQHIAIVFGSTIEICDLSKITHPQVIFQGTSESYGKYTTLVCTQILYNPKTELIVIHHYNIFYVTPRTREGFGSPYEL